jgi:RNA polymerase sigma factor (sigma-70 family)
VTKDKTPGTGPEKVERRDYAALVGSLADILDLRSGLNEVINIADYTAMSNRIAGLLDLEAGLQSALAVSTKANAERHLRASAETTTDSVADLLLRIQKGDAAAWDEIFRRYGSLVSTTVRSFRLRETDALDAVQMTWLRLDENAHRVRFPQRLGGWLATTARRECLHILRQVKPITGLTDVILDTVASPSVGSEQAGVADTEQTLRRLLAELSPRRRALVRTLFADTLSSDDEFVRAVRIPPGAIGPTRARALRQLRQTLEEHER